MSYKLSQDMAKIQPGRFPTRPGGENQEFQNRFIKPQKDSISGFFEEIGQDIIALRELATCLDEEGECCLVLAQLKSLPYSYFTEAMMTVDK